MRYLSALALMGLLAAYPAHAAGTDGPELATRFFNVIPDICFSTARGRPPTADNAGDYLLEVAHEVPSTVKSHFSRVPTWFRLKTQPNNVFVGIGDRPNACHVVLANTMRTVEVQRNVIGFLKVGGFQVVADNTVPGSDTDMVFAVKAPDGYLLVSLQAPRDVVRDGMGDQGAVHVNLMPAQMFEAMLSQR